MAEAELVRRERYLSRDAFERGMARSVASAPLILQHLRDLGISAQTDIRLQFFFYTNSPEKAAALSTALMKRKYLVEPGTIAARRNEKVVVGWTERMRMQEPLVLDWVRDMCHLGFAHDCKFDGWGSASRP